MSKKQGIALRLENGKYIIPANYPKRLRGRIIDTETFEYQLKKKDKDGA